MQTTAAAVTMVHDDAFFLERWVAYYGELLGRDACYVINHGHNPDVAKIAQGCNIIGIPGGLGEKFEVKRWRLFNGLQTGLQQYFKYVIVGDVDEYVIADPASGGTLLDFLENAPTRRIYTPLGLEVLHCPDRETDPITGPILGPRRFVRVNLHYAKPCVMGRSSKIARGGHYVEYDKLLADEALYLMHMKYCDFGQFSGAMDRRNANVAEAEAAGNDAGVGVHWHQNARGEDRAVFEAFCARPIEPFDMAPYRAKMHAGFEPRANGLWHFHREAYDHSHELPERFFGLI